MHINLLRLAADRARLAFDDRVRADPGARVLRLPPGDDGYPLYDAIRTRGDIVRSRSGLAFTASYSTASRILRSSEFGAVPTGVSRRGRTGLIHPLDDAFLTMDPPRHTTLRAVVAPAFGRSSIEALTGHIEETVDRHLDALATGTVVDLVKELIEPIPTSTICHLLGLPPSDIPKFVTWGRILATLIDGPRTPDEIRHTQAVLTEMTHYLRRRIHRPDPTHPAGEHLLDHLAQRCPADLTATDTIATAGMLLLGGFTTTVNLLGNAVLALQQHPKCRPDSRAAADAAVEETLRFDAPVQYVVRAAKIDTSIGPAAVPAGTPVVVLLAGANRDPAVFDHPDRFDPGRPNARSHLALGAGIHFCLGAALARLEAGITLHHLYRRYTLRLAGPDIHRIPSRGLRGLAHLPVRLSSR
jgi:cytochrome P450